MKFATFALVFAVAVVAVNSLPQFQTTSKFIPIEQQDDQRDESGRYTFRYVSGDGTTLRESGKLVPNDKGDDNVVIKEGSYTFTAPEGKTYTVNYVADKNGFQARGDHIPV